MWYPPSLLSCSISRPTRQQNKQPDKQPASAAANLTLPSTSTSCTQPRLASRHDSARPSCLQPYGYPITSTHPPRAAACPGPTARLRVRGYGSAETALEPRRVNASFSGPLIAGGAVNTMRARADPESRVSMSRCSCVSSSQHAAKPEALHGQEHHAIRCGGDRRGISTRLVEFDGSVSLDVACKHRARMRCRP